MHQKLDLLQLDDVRELKDQLLWIGTESCAFPSRVHLTDGIEQVKSGALWVLTYTQNVNRLINQD